MDKWKYIEGFGKDYIIYKNGVIRSNKTNKMLKWSPHTSGYVKVFLYQSGFRFTLLVHRLVAFHFCQNPNEEKYVLHMDHCKKNPHYKNLMFGSQSENIRQHYGRKKNKS